MIMFLRVVKFSKRINKEVDAKHLLFFMERVDCEAALAQIKILAVTVVAVTKVATMPSFDAIFFCDYKISVVYI